MTTVGELLKVTHVVEFCDGLWMQTDRGARFRFWHASRQKWGWWWTFDKDESDLYSKAPARLVPIAEADLDPNTRGEL